MEQIPRTLMLLLLRPVRAVPKVLAKVVIYTTTEISNYLYFARYSCAPLEISSFHFLKVEIKERGQCTCTYVKLIMYKLAIKLEWHPFGVFNGIAINEKHSQDSVRVKPGIS